VAVTKLMPLLLPLPPSGSPLGVASTKAAAVSRGGGPPDGTTGAAAWA
jgi:hypothetical protein